MLLVVCSFARLVFVTLVVVLRFLITVCVGSFVCVVCFMWLIWSYILLGVSWCGTVWWAVGWFYVGQF